MDEATQPNLLKQLKSAIRQRAREHLQSARVARQGEAMAAGDVQPDALLTVGQAAREFGVLRGDLYRAIQQGRLRPFRPTKPYLLKRSNVYEYVRNRRRERPL